VLTIGFLRHEYSSVLRALAEGTVGWAFWPPGTTVEQVGTDQEAACGVWIMGDELVSEDTEEDSEVDERDKHVSKDSEDEVATDSGDGDDDSDVPDKNVTVRAVGTRFGALMLDEVDEDDDGEV
jgi:hypothetical protein